MAGPINLGIPAETTIAELAETIIGLTGSQSMIEYHAQLIDDSTRRRPNIEKAQAALDRSPGVHLETSLEATIAYFDELLSGNPAGAGDNPTNEKICGRPDRPKIQAAE